MCITQSKYKRSLIPAIYVIFIFLFNQVYSQNAAKNDSILRISPVSIYHILQKPSFFSNDTPISLSSLIQPSSDGKDKNTIFYNSLKSKVSKNLITRKLYDLVMVSNDISNRITGTSDAYYLTHSGKRIRNIAIERLDVFGVNINNLELSDPRKIENFINKTHIYTNENIIRKNLLFSTGDTISPLILSDNERLLRQLPYIDDARVIIVPVSDDEADIIVLTKDIYSLGASFSYKGLKSGTVAVYEKNIFGIGHEFGVEMPYDADSSDSPGFGFHYTVDNIWKSFINLNLYYLDGIGVKTYGFDLSRRLVSSSSKYAGGISVRQMFTYEDLDTLKVPAPFKYNLQDYWLQRSFLINSESVSRIIIGARYTNNNVLDRPFILPNSYHKLQKYRVLLGSAAFSIQKYYKTNLIYGYGRTEDIPYGGLVKFTGGNEINEFKNRTYLGAEISYGKSSPRLGYYYATTGYATYLNRGKTEQGIFFINMNYFSNLLNLGRNRIRNFINVDYTRGFDRYSDEYLMFNHNNGFSGFRNDSLKGTQRLHLSLESVLFSHINIYGFRFAFFGFTDMGYLSGSNELIGNGFSLYSLGCGIRIRNANMVFNTFQVRFAFYPNPSQYSSINHIIISGEQLLRPNDFNSGPPTIIPYR